MKTIDSIPITKIARASKLVSTDAKVGVNYLKYYGDKMVNSKDEAKDRLNQNNAEDIYDNPVYTTNHIVSGINTYTTLAFNYYFGDNGLTEEDWINAQYDCENLPTNKKFKQY